MSSRPYDPSFLDTPEQTQTWRDFLAVVRQLRRDCPWDRVQTHESVRHLLIEETYEAVDAIDRQDWDELKKELGDLLLHVVFHSVIAEGDGRFTLEDIMSAEMDKLIRRHPHVFGDVAVNGVGEVLSNWEQIKQTEGNGQKKRGTLSGVPAILPALLRAHRIQEKAAGVGFDFPEKEEAWAKFEEEIGEFQSAVAAGSSTDKQEEELGDVFFALVNYARLAELNAENALRATNDKFARRFAHIEKRAEEAGKNLRELTLAEMDVWWDEAKALERASQAE